MSVLQATSDLSTIRSLSQYRPFEGGGESVKDAHEDLVLAALAEADGTCDTIEDCHSTIFTLFRVDLELLSIAGTLTGLVDEGRIAPDGSGFRLTVDERARLEELARESMDTARQALEDWRAFIRERAAVTADEVKTMEEDLAVFLKTVVRRHGIEATLLLYPEAEEAQGIYTSIEEEGFSFSPPRLHASTSSVMFPYQSSYVAQQWPSGPIWPRT